MTDHDRLTAGGHSRRLFLAALALAGIPAGFPLAALAEDRTAAVRVSLDAPFSHAWLIAEAQKLAQQEFQPDLQPDQNILDRIDWAAHGQIHFRPQDALFADGPGQYPVEFFYPGKFFRNRVRMFRLDGLPRDDQPVTAHELVLQPDQFDMPADSPAHAMSPATGYAGFRLQESRGGEPDWRSNDWAAFLGASYFRAIGDQYQYGLSARGIAVNTALKGFQEEFPAFTRFWFAPGEQGVTVFALLDGPSLTGAWRFDLTRETAVVMNVEARLFLRRDIARFGLAPATSMYWFSGKDKIRQTDWRPEVHDSDGLALHTGAGERIWRPLANPAGIRVCAFADHNPRGFGLVQRQRDFNRYLDAVHYERRPSLWIEPLDDWGEGSVQLIELHTEEEIYDNIVAMWVPTQPAKAGSSWHLRYRLTWAADIPDPTELARCVATRIGRGGEPGNRPAHDEAFVVEFDGPLLASLPPGQEPQATVSASRGEIVNVAVEAVPDQQPARWRARFELRNAPPAADPVELRLVLHANGRNVSETWLYAHDPA